MVVLDILLEVLLLLVVKAIFVGLRVGNVVKLPLLLHLLPINILKK